MEEGIQKPLVIKRLHAENFKRINMIDISPHPTAPIVDIVGANGEGKTSTLDVILALLGGNNKANIPKPVKDGAKKAVLEIEIEGFLIKKIITSKSQRFQITDTKSGEDLMSPQSVIDRFMGTFTLDPMKLYQMDATEQKNEVLRILGIQEEIEKIDKEIEEIKNKAKTERSIVVYHKGKLPETEPEEIKQQSVGQLTQQLEEAQALNLVKESMVKDLETIEKWNTELIELQEKIKAKEEEIKAKKEEMNKKQQHVLSSKCEPVELLKRRIEDIDRNNQKASIWEDFLQITKGIEEANQKINTYKDEVKRKREKIDEIINDQKMPIKGLRVDEAGLLLNEIPLKQASTAEQIKICIFFAMKLAPELKILRIMNGSLLDKNSKEVIKKMAIKYGFQIWIESVTDDKDSVGFYIEDGSVLQKTECLSCGAGTRYEDGVCGKCKGD